MRNLKRALCLALASVMVLGMTVIGASAATASDFTDYDTVEEKEALDVMAAIDVIEGTESGAFNPEGHFTREQAAKILSVMLLGSGNADKLNNNAQIFKDVAAGKWSAGYVAYCSNVGIIAGDGKGNFNPEGELDSVSFGKMLLVALGYDPAKEGYINNPGWQQSIAGDMIEAGIDVSDVKFDDVLTREQATVMAFKAIQTPLVEYSNYLDPSKANYVTTTVAKTQTISSQKLSNSDDYTIEFGEKFQPDLVKSGDDTEEFCRPAHKWTYGSVKIGRYNDTPDQVYTTEVTNGQIYNDLGLNETILVGHASKTYDENGKPKTDPATSEYYIDGSAVAYRYDQQTGKDVFEDPAAGLTDDQVLVLKNKDDIKLGGNGTVTEVYYHDISYDDHGNKEDPWAQIVSVNTYVGDVTAKVGDTAKHVAYITITGRWDDKTVPNGAPYTDEKRPTYKNGTKTGTVENAKYETEDFTLGDIVLYTYSRKYDTTTGEDLGVQSVKVAEVVTGNLSAFTTNDRVTIDGDSYSYNSKVAHEAKTKDLKFDVDIVLDDYGYAIDVDPVGLNTGYAVILNVGIKYNGSTGSNGTGDWNDTNAVQLLLSDGTVVEKALLNNDEPPFVQVGDIVRYEIDNRDRYRLEVMASANTNTEVATSSSPTENNKVTFSVERGVFTFNFNSTNVTAGGSTIFLVRTKTAYGDYKYASYQGIKNVPTINTGSNSVPATVFVQDHVASMVYIDASDKTTSIDALEDDYAYVRIDPKVQMTQDTERGNYYHYEVIINGEIISVDVDETTYKEIVQQSSKSKLFNNVQVDEYDVYSFDGNDAFEGTGIKNGNGALDIDTSNTPKSFVIAADCDVFYVDEDGAISSIDASTITDNQNVHIWYILNSKDEFTCIIIEEPANP